MKKIYFTITLFLFMTQIYVFSQISTKNPYVENHTQSDVADLPIFGVSVGEEITMILFEYITNRNLSGGWISLSSRTTLTAKNSTISLKIKEWGLYDGETTKILNFNEKYTVKSDRKYAFYMVFPKLTSGLENITIRENEGNSEFYWKGIHIINPIVSSSKNEQSFSVGKRAELESDKLEIAGSGSGFAISTNGLIATSYHVVKDANRIQIRGVNGDFDNVFKAKVIAFDKNNDLAVLKIDDVNFKLINLIPYTLNDKITDVGEDIFVLGYPLRAIMGDEIKLTNGLISSKSGFQGDVTSYQISATVQSGNSGCPLFDKNGNVIGIVNSRLFVENAAYAVKTPYLRTLISTMDTPLALSTQNSLIGKSLSEQVKEIRKFVYIIEIEEK